MHEIFPTNPFQSMLHIGTRTRYVPVEGLKGVSDEGEMVRDNVYIKREQKYDRRKFGKLYIDALYELDGMGTNGWRLFIRLLNVMEVGKDYVYLSWGNDSGIKKDAYRRGLNELLDKNVLAKTDLPYKFWVNTSILNRG